MENTQEEEKDLTAIAHERTSAGALAILKIIADHGTLPTGLLTTKEEGSQTTFEMNQKIRDYLITTDIDFKKDVEMIGMILGTTIDLVMTEVGNSLARNFNMLNDSLFGIKEGENPHISVKMLNDMVVRRNKVLEAGEKIRGEAID